MNNIGKYVIYSLLVTKIYSIPEISIYKYESPPTRWLTNGIILVGVTDGECSITTSIERETKWGAGKTVNNYKAVEILKNLQNNGFDNINSPYGDYGFNNEVITVSLAFHYGNCKILIKNETDNTEFTEEEYIGSYFIISENAKKNLYTSTEITYRNKSNKKRDEFMELIAVISVISIILFIILCCCIIAKTQIK